MELHDVQSQRLSDGFNITRVGISGVVKPLVISRPGRDIPLVCTFEVGVDLPHTQKGSHMSRNVESINEVVDRAATEKYPGIEGLAREVAVRLLKAHDYATNAFVSVTAPYFLEREFEGRKSLERYTLHATARATHGQPTKTELGVTVCGMTVCPCAMENVQALLGKDAPGAGEPSLSHNQRNELTVFVELPEGREIEADRLIALAESSLSAPTFEYLKREAEARIVLQAHRNPRFVEDVVRGLLRLLLDELKDWPGATAVRVKSVSLESIHQHDAFAERVTTLGELREP